MHPGPRSRGSVELNIEDDNLAENTELLLIGLGTSAEATLPAPNDPLFPTSQIIVINPDGNDEPRVSFTSAFREVEENEGVISNSLSKGEPASQNSSWSKKPSTLKSTVERSTAAPGLPYLVNDMLAFAI